MTRTLSRGLDVLEALARGNEHGLGPSAIGQRVGLDKATVTRLLRTLVEAGYVTQDETTRRYRLTGKILWLAHRVTVRLDLRSVARPHLTALRDELGETVHLGVMEDLRVVYVDKLEADNSIQLVSAVGQTMPLHSTSLGKAMLAALPDEEREGKYARMDFLPRTDRTILDLDTFREEIHANAAPRLLHRRPRERAVRGVRRGGDRRSRRTARWRDQHRRSVLPDPRSPRVLRRTGARRGRSDRPGAGGRRGRADRRARPRHSRGDLMPPRGRGEARRRLRADLHALRRERGRRPRRPAVQPRALRGERDPRLPGAGVQRREPEPGGRREAARPRRRRAPQGAGAGGPGRCRVRRAARGRALPRGRGGSWGRLRARPVAGLLPGADDGRGPVPLLLLAGRRGRRSRSSSTTPRASAASP